MWQYFKPILTDNTKFRVARNENEISISTYIQDLLEKQKYYGALLPRIPKKIEIDLKVYIL